MPENAEQSQVPDLQAALSKLSECVKPASAMKPEVAERMLRASMRWISNGTLSLYREARLA